MTSKKLWPIFSKTLRKESADHAGFVRCITCPRVYHWEEVDLGHFLRNNERTDDFGGNELWYDERNFAPQCRACNYYHAEEGAKLWAIKLAEKLGAEALEEMDMLRLKPKMFSTEELQTKADFYKLRLAQL